MNLLMIVLLLWTLLGAAGTALALARGERRRARRGALWVGAVWAVYLALLVGVSLKQPARLAPPGTEQCFDEMCFSVVGAEEVEGFWVRGVERERLLRVAVRIANHGRSHAERESGLHSYLVDGAGRRWSEVPGLTGVRLSTLVTRGGATVSEPVFSLPKSTSGLGLVLRHGRFSPNLLVIGDPESWLHRPEVLLLPTSAPAATGEVRR